MEFSPQLIGFFFGGVVLSYVAVLLGDMFHF